MSIKGFYLFIKNEQLPQEISFAIPVKDGNSLWSFNYDEFDFSFHTGAYDRNYRPIFVGDMLRQKSCEIPFEVEDVVSFLIMCGRYEEKHGTPIFDSLEVVDDK